MWFLLIVFQFGFLYWLFECGISIMVVFLSRVFLLYLNSGDSLLKRTVFATIDNDQAQTMACKFANSSFDWSG